MRLNDKTLYLFFSDVHKKLCYDECIDEEFWNIKFQDIDSEKNTIVLLQALYYFRFNKFDKAQQILNSYKDAQLNNSYFFLLQGLLAETPDLKLVSFEKSLRLERENKNENPWIFSYLFSCPEFNDDEAEKYLNEGLNKYPDFIQLVVDRYTLLRLNDESKALHYLEKEYTRLNDPYLLLIIGKNYFEQNKYDDAIKIIKKAIDIYPLWGSYLMLGDIYFNRADIVNAEKYYLMATSIDACKCDSFKILGKFYMDIGELLKAEQYFHLGLDIEEDEEIKFYLVNLKILQNNWGLAEEILKNIKRTPENKKDAYLFTLIILHRKNSKDFNFRLNNMLKDLSEEQKEWLRNECTAWEIYF